MPVRFLTDDVREQLSGFPAELDSEALDRFFTFSDADLAEISRRHGDGNRLGWALQPSGLRLLGFCPADVTTAPAGAVAVVARPLCGRPGGLEGYRAPRQTPTGPGDQV